MNVHFGNNIIASYKRLSYTPWYALAEFVDNSTQAYFDNEKDLIFEYKKSNTTLIVNIIYDRAGDKITIKDNSIGMDADDLQRALTIGDPPKNCNGRSRYGLGMKTAACWIGNYWTVITSKLGEDKVHRIEFDVDAISSKNDTDLKHVVEDEDQDKHYTIIEISSLNRTIQGRTLGAIRNYLGSMYRLDFKNYGFKLYWQDDLVNWIDLEEGLYLNQSGEKWMKSFEFDVNEKSVTGWIGILGPGNASRKNAGFSVMQADRAIQGWPGGFRPEVIFGDQEGGRNDLINQRIVGEMFLDIRFAVSHTKDKIVWLGDEYEVFSEKLLEVCKEIMAAANSIRFREAVVLINVEANQNKAFEELSRELNSVEIIDIINTKETPPENIIKESYSQLSRVTKDTNEPDYQYTIGKNGKIITVRVFLISNSVFEPYVIIETSTAEDTVIVIINSLHPHYTEMKDSDSLLNFLRHCVYDGVAEWQAQKMYGSIQPNTIKFLKDGLLRLPFEMKNTSESGQQEDIEAS